MLLSLFSYHSETGEIRWRAVRPYAHQISVGCLAGTVSRNGYLVIGLDRKYFGAHRIIWKMMTGSDPDDQIDHINGNRLDNRWSNLRAANNGQNRWNTKIAKNNTSGIKGVCFDKARDRWVASIAAGGSNKKLGRFKSKQEAIAARRLAETAMHGEFARAA